MCHSFRSLQCDITAYLAVTLRAWSQVMSHCPLLRLLRPVTHFSHIGFTWWPILCLALKGHKQQLWPKGNIISHLHCMPVMPFCRCLESAWAHFLLCRVMQGRLLHSKEQPQLWLWQRPMGILQLTLWGIMPHSKSTPSLLEHRYVLMHLQASKHPPPMSMAWTTDPCITLTP